MNAIVGGDGSDDEGLHELHMSPNPSDCDTDEYSDEEEEDSQASEEN